VRRISREVVEDAAGEGIEILEVRLSPAFMTRFHPLDWDELLRAVAEGAAAGADGAGSDGGGSRMRVGLLLIASRDLGIEAAHRTLDLALAHRDQVCGFDLAGPEAEYPAELFREVFERAAAEGLPVTVHAGEAGPASEVEAAVTRLHAARIGHGVKAAEDPAVVDLLVERGVVLEMCPTSNWITRAAPSLEEHPCRRLIEAGVKVTLSTDDPAVFGTTLPREFEIARDVWGLGEPELAALDRNARDATFLSVSG
jgi:adenosine deaminase